VTHDVGEVLVVGLRRAHTEVLVEGLRRARTTGVPPRGNADHHAPDGPPTGTTRPAPAGTTPS